MPSTATTEPYLLLTEALTSGMSDTAHRVVRRFLARQAAEHAVRSGQTEHALASAASETRAAAQRNAQPKPHREGTRP